MSPIRRLCLVGVSLLVLSQAGCLLMGAAAVGGGATTFAIVNGKATYTFDASLPATATAIESALRDLDLPVERPRIGELYGEIDSTLADGGPVLIDLKSEPRLMPKDPPRTKVGIHVKVFGDKKVSQQILDQISYRLNNPAPVTTVAPPSSPPAPPLAEQSDEPGLAPAGFTPRKP
jgi:hypothetical protein